MLSHFSDWANVPSGGGGWRTVLVASVGRVLICWGGAGGDGWRRALGYNYMRFLDFPDIF